MAGARRSCRPCLVCRRVWRRILVSISAGSATDLARSDDLSEFLIFLCGGAPFYDGEPVSRLLSPLCSSADTYQRFVDHLVAVLFRRARGPTRRD
ncbi:hypothetical protein QW131_11205 [Roseibium salinum]|nr:hypothetical protein [Roseibium salinum]